jgi:hypothetical protein
MDTRTWIERQLTASVTQNRGKWLSGVTDDELGDGIFAWLAMPELRLHEDGMTLIGPSGWRVLYKDIVDVTWLNLRALSAANSEPQKPVDVSITTHGQTLRVVMHLYDYTGFASTVPGLTELATKI